MITLIVIAISYILYKLYHRHNCGPQAHCIIQVGNLTEHINIAWTKLVYPPEFYTIQVKNLKQDSCEARVFNNNWPISKARIQLTNLELKIMNASLDLI